MVKGTKPDSSTRLANGLARLSSVSGLKGLGEIDVRLDLFHFTHRDSDRGLSDCLVLHV